MYKKIFFLVDLFWACFDHDRVTWTKCRLVTKHVLSSTHFHSWFFLTFPLKFHLYKKLKLSIKDYLLLIYTFMCMIIFLRIIILSFQSHQTRIHSAGLGKAWNRHRLSCIKDCIVIEFNKHAYLYIALNIEGYPSNNLSTKLYK